jgi:hypothetical protein
VVKLYPPSLVRAILDAPEHAVAQCSDLPLLLVKLEDPEGKLAHWLEATARSNPLKLIAQDSSAETRTRISPALEKAKPGDSERQRTRQPRAMSATMLEKQLNESPHFGLLLAKRQPMTLDPRIKVGRSRLSDVMLYHPTVSSAHAWIDSDEQDTYFVTDNGSTNGTRLNGKKLQPSKTVDAYPGDHIQFGDVQTTLCLLAMLRNVLIRAAQAAR